MMRQNSLATTANSITIEGVQEQYEFYLSEK